MINIFFKLMKNSVFGKTIKSMKKPLNLQQQKGEKII